MKPIPFFGDHAPAAEQPAAPEQPAPAPEQAPASAPEQPAAPSPAPEQPAAPAPAPEQPAQPAASADVESQLAAMRAEIERLSQQAAAGQLSRAPVDEELVARVNQLREAFADWPQRGDKFASAPQPYELQQLGLPQPGVNRDHLPGGEPDNISPVVVSHALPQVTPGSAGSPVSLLAQLLAKIGYPTSISRGQNHTFSFDESVNQAVQSFKRDWHVVEDSTAFRTAEEAAQTVGPWIWEALLRATKTL
jgi:hypothetical protein